MSRSRAFLALVLASAAAAITPHARAEAPGYLPIQGTLSDARGTPVDDQVSIRFRLYGTATPTGAKGEILFEEQVPSVSVSHGYFAVYLGEAKPLRLSLFREHPTVFVGMLVEGDSQELTPLLQLATAPYAAFAQYCADASTLEGKSAGDFLESDYVPAWTDIEAKPSTFPPSAHQHAWSDLTGTPRGLDDGDDDALAALSCDVGQVAKFSGGAWTCGTTAYAHTHAADEITSGTLSNARFSAYNDLATDGYLDNNDPGDMLTRSQADERYAAATGHTHSGADITSGTIPPARVDAYTRSEADSTFTRLKGCYWKTNGCPTNPSSGTPPTCSLLCDTGDIVVSGGCAGAAGATVRENMPYFSVPNTNGRWTVEQMVGWYCRASTGQMVEVRVMCCPSI